MTKIIHCADLHLDSPMETHMTEEQASIRNTEIIHTFLRLTEYAAKNDVRAVIIAGDMFDGERIKIRTVDEILDAIRRTPNVDYLYLAGNHDGATYAFADHDMPDNLKIFGKEWTTYKYDSVAISGVEICEANSQSLYLQVPHENGVVNIVTLHGQVGVGELRTDISKNQQYLHEMDKNYPAGYPTPEEIKTQRENLSVIQQERQRLQALKFNNADREIVDREQQWFADNDKVVSDIDHCDQDCKELGEVSAKVTAQMLPEELERLKILSERFKSSLPTEEELKKYMDIADELSDAQHRQADLSIPVENQKCLARLKELFGSGMPSDSVLDACEQAQHDRDVLKQSRAVHGFPESEQQQYEALKRTFASGVPTEDEIRDKQKDSRRIAELITRKNTQTTIVQQERVSETPPALKMPLALRWCRGSISDCWYCWLGTEFLDSRHYPSRYWFWGFICFILAAYSICN